MSIYDIVMLVVFGGAVFFGFWKGLAWQIASLAAIIVSYLVAINFREPVAQYIQAEAPWNKIGAMLVLFIGTSLVIWTIYSRISKTIKKMELKGFDRQAGALLGAVKGVLLCMVVTVLSVSWLGDRAHDTIHHSKLGPYIVSGIGAVSAVVPAEVAHIINPQLDEFKKAIGHDINLLPEASPQDGSRYKIGSGLFGQDQDQETPEDPPTFLRGQLKWNTSAAPTGNSLQFDGRQTSYLGGTYQSVLQNADPSYAQGFVETATDGFFKNVADLTKSAFESSSQRK